MIYKYRNNFTNIENYFGPEALGYQDVAKKQRSTCIMEDD
jgi:hypothetical protein